MIGLYLRWSGNDPQPPVAARFAASLSVGTTRKPISLVRDGAVFATACGQPHRPIRLPSGETLLFEGHIQNRVDLRRELGQSLADDPALYAAAYTAWGDAADLRVLGEFCTIIADPENRRVRLSRAPLQGPPLHYYSDGEHLVVASTPRAIFATGVVEQKVNEQKIADSLVLNYADAEQGWFVGLHRLPAATRLVHQPGRVIREPYYDPLAVAPVRLKSDAAYVEAADALFEEGCRAVLDGFFRPAISISGGLDSQAVAAYALRVMPEHQRLRGYTSVPEAGWDGRIAPHRLGDESAHARAFAAMYPRLDLELVDSAGLGLDDTLRPMFLLASAAPRNSMNLYWTHEIHRRARAAGCDVVLNGGMGNLGFSFGGDARLPHLLRTGRWRTLVRELRAMRDGRSFARKLATTAAPLLPARLQDRILHVRGLDIPLEDYSAIRPEYAAEMHATERAVAMEQRAGTRYWPGNDAVRTAMLLGAREEGGDIIQGLELIHGVPMRDPTAYRPLIEFCFAIPDDQFYKLGQSRRLARRMLQGMLPEMVLNERRRGLQGADWHLRLGRQRRALLEQVERLSGDPAMAHRLDLGRIKAALADWPEETPIDSPQGLFLQLAVTRALTTARFIRYVDGRNDG